MGWDDWQDGHDQMEQDYQDAVDDMKNDWNSSVEQHNEFFEKGFQIPSIIFGGVFVVIFLIIFITTITKLVKSHKQEKQFFDGYLDNINEALEDEIHKDDVYYCEYCGTPMEKGQHKCPNCGATKKKRR